MTAKKFEEKFLDYLDGNLSDSEATELETALEKNRALKNAFEAYQRVVAVERRLAEEKHKPGPQLAVKVMDRIEEVRIGFFARLFMGMNKRSLQLASGAAFVATVGIVLALSRQVPSGPLTRTSHEQASHEQGAPAPASGAKLESPSSLEFEEESRQSPEDVEDALNPPSGESSKRDDGARVVEAEKDKDTALPEKYPQAAKSLSDEKLRAKKEQNPDSSKEREANPYAGTADLGRAGAGVKQSEAVLKRLDETRKNLDTPPPPPIADNKPLENNRSESRLQLPETKQASSESASVGVEFGRTQTRPSRSVSNSPKAEAGRHAMEVMPDYKPAYGNVLPTERQRAAGRPEFASRRPATIGKGVWQQKVTESEGYAEPSIAADRMEAPAPVAKPRQFPQGIIAPPPPRPEPVPVTPPPVFRDADEGDNYTAYEEQPRVQTKDEPMSTFSVDVDTASYTNARRFLQAGSFPPASSVRVEEFINYFDYNYPSQREKPFQLNYEIAPSPLESDRLLLSLGIRARDAVSEIKPWNLVFLIDVSGSMSPPDRLELIKKGLHVLVQNMRENDKVAIVTYAGAAGLVLDSTSIKESAKILSAIDALRAGGSTNGEGGILMAYEVAERSRIAGGVNRVVLATDGDFNVGTTSNDSLVKLIEEKRKSGVTLTTLGVGTNNLKDARLEQLANKGNGNFYYLDSFQEARRVLGEKIGGTMEVVAKDVKLQIEFNPQHVAQYRLIGYDNRKLAKEDFNNDAVDAGEIGVGHEVTALYEVVLTNTDLARRLNTEYRYRAEAPEASPPPAKEGMDAELAFLKIRYKEPDANTSQLLEFPIDASRVKKSTEEASADFRFASAVAYFATLLRGSKFAGNYTYKDIAALAERSVEGDPSGQRREFVSLVKNAAALRPGTPAQQRY